MWLASPGVTVLIGLLCASQVVPSVQAFRRDRTVDFGDSEAGPWDDDEDWRAESFWPERSYGSFHNRASDPWELFKQSGLFVEPFEPGLKSLPAPQLEFQRLCTAKDTLLFQEVIEDAIANADAFGSNARLLVKWGPKLLNNFLEYRRNELALKEKHPPLPAFYTVLADMIEQITDYSTTLMDQRGYSPKTVDRNLLRLQTTAAFDHAKRIIDMSPVGNYLHWEKAVFYKDQPNNLYHNVELRSIAADMLARFRGIGYEGIAFVMRRLVNMFRQFGMGQLPPSVPNFY